MPKNKQPTEKVARDLDYQTPEMILEPVRKLFGGCIPLDPATDPTNPTKAGKFHTPLDDGLTHSWDCAWFLNPPYGPEVPAWCAKLHREALERADVPGVALLPGGSRTETFYWQEHVYNHRLVAICFIRRRVAFIRPSTGEPAKSNNFGSALYGYNVDPDAFVAAFEHLGRCIVVKVVGADPQPPKQRTGKRRRPAPVAVGSPNAEELAALDALPPIDKLSKRAAVDELTAMGVSGNADGPVGKQPLAVLRGMVQKHRTDRRARAEGAGPCADHPDQVSGVCPYCAGIWVPPLAPEPVVCARCSKPMTTPYPIKYDGNHMHTRCWEQRAAAAVDVAMEGFAW